MDMKFKRKRINSSKENEIDINLRIENNEATADDYISIGDISYQNNNLDKAILNYQKAIEIEQNGNVYFKIAQIYHETKSYQLALIN